MQASVSFERSEVTLARKYHPFAAALFGAAQCTTAIRASSELLGIVRRFMGAGSTRERREELKSSPALRFYVPVVLNRHTSLRLRAIGAALSLPFARGASAAGCSSTEV